MIEDEAPPLQTRASAAQIENRKRLVELFTGSPLPTEQLLVNLPLYMRSSALAKLLYINELYELIVPRPGVIMEFGVWWGSNLALFESLRAVYEPYNYTRRIVGFDTFEGYPAVAPEDGDDELAAVGAYAVGAEYLEHLTAVLDYHRQENPMSHLSRFEVVRGDAALTLSDYLERHPETIVALAAFDMQLYEPTKACLEIIRPHLARGSVLALDELNTPEFPGETIAFREVFGLDRYQLHRSRYLPDRTYLVVD
jgi:hypothetical protein